MAEFKQGDMVRVAYDAQYHASGENGAHFVFGDQYVMTPANATIELIEPAKPADDPSKDPIGTVRSSGIRGGQWAKRRTLSGCDVWAYIAGHFGMPSMTEPSATVVGWKVIGAVPGTPAWDAWSKGELKNAPEFPGTQLDGFIHTRGPLEGQPIEAGRPDGYPYPLGTKVRGYRPSQRMWETGYLIEPAFPKVGMVSVGRTRWSETGNHLRASDLERVE